jgi:hypothetical protein
MTVVAAWQWQCGSVGTHSARPSRTVASTRHTCDTCGRREDRPPHFMILRRFSTLTLWDAVVASGVAVAGWEWCHSIDHINAVRMVPVREW